MKLFSRDSDNSNQIPEEGVSEKEFYESFVETIAEEDGVIGLDFPILRNEDGDVVFRDALLAIDGIARDPEGNTVIFTSFGTVTLVSE